MDKPQLNYWYTIILDLQQQKLNSSNEEWWECSHQELGLEQRGQVMLCSQTHHRIQQVDIEVGLEAMTQAGASHKLVYQFLKPSS
jgi:hypothetical protein